MTCCWHGAAPVSPSAAWYLGRDSQSRGILTAAQHQLTLCSVILLKNSTEKGICHFSRGHRRQAGSDQRWGTHALHFGCGHGTLWSFPQALHGVSFSWVTLKHRNLSGLKQRLDDESMGIARMWGGHPSVRAQLSFCFRLWEHQCVVLGSEMPSSALAECSLGIYCGQQFLRHTWLQCLVVVSWAWSIFIKIIYKNNFLKIPLITWPLKALKKQIFLPTLFALFYLTDWWLIYLPAKPQHLKKMKKKKKSQSIWSAMPNYGSY